MKIIQGKNGKSLVLADYLKTIQDKDIILVDIVNIPFLHELANTGYLIVEESLKRFMDDMIHMSKWARKDKPLISEDNFYVFSVNCNPSDIGRFLEFERATGYSVVITVQTNEETVRINHKYIDAKETNVWTVFQNPWVMGGNVQQPTGFEHLYNESYDIGCGFQGVVVTMPNGQTRVIELQTGGIIGNTIEEIRKNSIGCTEEQLQEQVDNAKHRWLRGRGLKFIDKSGFWKEYIKNK